MMLTVVVVSKVLTGHLIHINIGISMHMIYIVYDTRVHDGTFWARYIIMLYILCLNIARHKMSIKCMIS